MLIYLVGGDGHAVKILRLSNQNVQRQRDDIVFLRKSVG
jgi:hypothetical protein